MDKSIKELKNIIQDGMTLLAGDGTGEKIIKRLPNNVLRIDNKLVSWQQLHDWLTNGEYMLLINEDEPELVFPNKKSKNLDFSNKKNKNWGGVRTAGKGKKIGRPQKTEKKRTVSFSLDAVSIAIIEQVSQERGIKKSEALTMILQNFQRKK